ncbi:hypothetical protein CesoFtcFv8_011524 [Champsocephalus esox]|uniref:Uncharacterized protein n=1 Tax=Champsocephalus esox TaxID=159716 RepID=A0AAN8GY60_9TELE|nr:hypothetical protein CesoFtcFv8_011524 [Champsocephalus esox]
MRCSFLHQQPRVILHMMMMMVMVMVMVMMIPAIHTCGNFWSRPHLTLCMMLFSPPQRSPPLSHIVTPPPMVEEVEVVTQPECSFKSLITLPVRERPTTSRQRAKPII